VQYALSHGIIDRGSTRVEESFLREADLVVMALYPHVFLEWMEEYGRLLPRGSVITDVTGVKSAVVFRVQKMLPEGVEFIAAHPMAGREVGGVENSDDAIFRGANYIVVPTEHNTKEAVETCKDIGKLLGFQRVSELSPEAHDEMIGFVSQLTHAIAVSLMTSCDNEELVNYTGDSFRDLTRIARINDAMWSELFLLNKDALLAQMDVFMKEFSDLREALNQEDSEKIREKMRLSTTRRALFDKK